MKNIGFNFSYHKVNQNIIQGTGNVDLISSDEGLTKMSFIRTGHGLKVHVLHKINQEKITKPHFRQLMSVLTIGFPLSEFQLRTITSVSEKRKISWILLIHHYVH